MRLVARCASVGFLVCLTVTALGPVAATRVLDEAHLAVGEVACPAPEGDEPCMFNSIPAAIDGSEAARIERCVAVQDPICADAAATASWHASEDGAAIDASVDQEIYGRPLAALNAPADSWQREMAIQASVDPLSPEGASASANAAWVEAGSESGRLWLDMEPASSPGRSPVKVQSRAVEAVIDDLAAGGSPLGEPSTAPPAANAAPEADLAVPDAPADETSVEAPAEIGQSHVESQSPIPMQGAEPRARVLALSPDPGVPGTGGMWLAVGLTVTIGVAGLSLAYWAATTCVAMFTRLRKSSLLAQKARAEILDVLRENPWATFSRLSVATGLTRSTLRYHLRILQVNGLVTRQRGGRAELFADRSTGPPPAYQAPMRRFLKEELGGTPRPLAILVRRLVEARMYSRSGAWRAIQAAHNEGVVQFQRRDGQVLVGEPTPLDVRPT